jgi:hypothetical protein
MTSYRWVPEELKTVLSNCDAKRDHNYSLGADSFTITTREYALLCEVISAAPAESGDALEKMEEVEQRCDQWFQMYEIERKESRQIVAYALSLMEVEGNYDKALQYLRAVDERLDAALKSDKGRDVRIPRPDLDHTDGGQAEWPESPEEQ